MSDETQHDTMRKGLLLLVKAAVRAPSGDNMQPWRFVIDPVTGRLAVYLDVVGDIMPFEKSGIYFRIALGTALENIVRCAHFNGWKIFREEPREGALAFMRIDGVGQDRKYTIPPVIAQRMTNRRMYDGRELPDQQVHRLKETMHVMHGVEAIWVTERERLEDLADIIAEADALLFRDFPSWKEFLHRIRFDEPHSTHVDWGLSLASLEVNAFDRLGLKMARRMPWLMLRVARANWLLGNHARRAIESSSGVCLLAASDQQAATDLAIGRTFEHVWLNLTDMGMAVQPMTSVAGIYTVLHGNNRRLQHSIGVKQMEVVLDELNALVPELRGRRPGELLRFGYADSPSHYAGRRPLADVVEERTLG